MYASYLSVYVYTTLLPSFNQLLLLLEDETSIILIFLENLVYGSNFQYILVLIMILVTILDNFIVLRYIVLIMILVTVFENFIVLRYKNYDRVF